MKRVESGRRAEIAVDHGKSYRLLVWGWLILVLVPSVCMTAFDTWVNPAGIFRQGWNLQGAIVWETLWSWLWPLTLALLGLWALAALLRQAYWHWRR